MKCAVPDFLTKNSYCQRSRRASFWKNEYAGYSDSFRGEAVAPIQNKIGKALMVPSLRNMLAQPSSTITFRRLMDEGAIVICNLSKGSLGESTAHLLGALITTALAQAALSRDLTSFDEMRAELSPLIDKVWRYCDSTGVRARTVTLKVKFADFRIVTRRRTHKAPVMDCSMFASISADMLAAQFPMRKEVRLIGVSLSSLCTELQEEDPQMTLAL